MHGTGRQLDFFSIDVKCRFCEGSCEGDVVPFVLDALVLVQQDGLFGCADDKGG